MPSFVTGPTPVDSAPRLAVALGLGPDQLFVKRDDLIGLGGGGNKVRKLEVTMAEALAAGAHTVVTTGAAQSNHARLTAAAAARLGLRAVLVLEGERPGAPTGNLLLEDVLDAEIVFAGARGADQVAATIAERHGVHRIPFGGTSPASAEAYRAAGHELIEQVPDVGTVVVALGSGGTMAGLVAALGPERVLGAHTGAVREPRRVVADLLRDMGAAGGDRLRIDEDQVGAAYPSPGPAVRDALLLVARTEGIILDPIYTARAMAALVAAARRSAFGAAPVVFLHTGGLPGLFGRPDLVSSAV
jgi:L-cysteate sulfo-lyase